MSSPSTWRPGALALLLLLAGGCGSSVTPSDGGSDGAATDGPGGPDGGLEAGAPCTRDRECDDGRFCNGAERCVEGGDAGPGLRCAPAEQPACPRRSCDEEADRCDVERGWLVTTRELGGQVGTDLAISDAGTVFVTGGFTESIDLGGEPLLDPDDVGRMFVASFDPAGAHRWSAAFGEPASGGGIGLGGADDVVHVAGKFRDRIDFGDGLHESAGSSDIFLTSFTRDGTTLSSRAIGGVEGEGVASLAVSPRSNLTLSGCVIGPVDFGGGTLEPEGGTTCDVFLASYDADGGHRWSELYGEPGSDVVEDVEVDDAGNVYAVGEFQNGIDFGGGRIRAERGQNAFVVSLTDEGAHRWSRAMNAFVVTPAAVAVTSERRVYVAGLFKETLEVEEGAELEARGGFDAFVVAFEPDGSYRWARRFGGPNEDERFRKDEAFAIAVDEAGNVYFTMQYRGPVDFGGGPLGREGELESAIVSLTPEGEHRWSVAMGTATQLFGLEVGPEGHVYATGTFNGLLEWNGERHWSADGAIDFVLMQILQP